VSRDDGTLKVSAIEPATGRLVVRHPSFATIAMDLPARGPNTVGLILRPGHRTLLRLSEDENPTTTPNKFQVTVRCDVIVKDSATLVQCPD
jgi:hypothetical protein